MSRSLTTPWLTRRERNEAEPSNRRQAQLYQRYLRQQQQEQEQKASRYPALGAMRRALAFETLARSATLGKTSSTAKGDVYHELTGKEPAIPTDREHCEHETACVRPHVSPLVPPNAFTSFCTSITRTIQEHRVRVVEKMHASAVENGGAAYQTLGESAQAVQRVAPSAFENTHPTSRSSLEDLRKMVTVAFGRIAERGVAGTGSDDGGEPEGEEDDGVSDSEVVHCRDGIFFCPSVEDSSAYEPPPIESLLFLQQGEEGTRGASTQPANGYTHIGQEETTSLRHTHSCLSSPNGSNNGITLRRRWKRKEDAMSTCMKPSTENVQVHDALVPPVKEETDSPFEQPVLESENTNAGTVFIAPTSFSFLHTTLRDEGTDGVATTVSINPTTTTLLYELEEDETFLKYFAA